MGKRAEGKRGAGNAPPSDHFDGRRFFTPPPDGVEKSFRDLLRWVAKRSPPKWREVPVTPTIPKERVGEGGMQVTWIGHATLLVQFEGMNLLTDPIWSRRAFPLPFMGPRRFAEPGVAFADLPPIDVVAISHNHYDHLDRATVERLSRTHDPHFFVPLGLARWFRKRGMDRVTELDWWEEAGIGPLRVTAVPARHWSRRGLFDGNETLWCGWVVTGAAGRFFFAGDTGYSERFAEIGERFAPLRLAALPIGAYAPRWFMGPQHIDPAEAVQIHRAVGARVSVAIHHNTFQLADEPQEEPPRRLRAALEVMGIGGEAFWVLRHGETRDVPLLESEGGFAGTEPHLRQGYPVAPKKPERS
ncbi:MAG: MBL fold metallo-hydrolase [Deltaproteobacteria bacterium]|nr:MAG: MBL fold metallo-hydrolase [Deltaproteobacteria bacterium]